jgi:hypothetical protein
VVFLPFVAVIAYLITWGHGMAERADARRQRAQEQFDGYVRNVAATGDGSPTEQIARARSCWTRARSTSRSSTG